VCHRQQQCGERAYPCRSDQHHVPCQHLSCPRTHARCNFGYLPRHNSDENALRFALVGRPSGRHLRQQTMPISFLAIPRVASVIALKDALATLVQRYAMAVLQHFFEQAAHRFDPCHEPVQLLELLAGQFLPTLGCPRLAAEAEEELPDFVERETAAPRPLDDREPVKHGGVVATAPADAFAGKQHAYFFVIANGGGLEADPPRHL